MLPVCRAAKDTVGYPPKRFQRDGEASMGPKGVSRMLASMPAGHGNGGAGTLRPAISIHENFEFRHAEIDARADGEKSHKCGKTHIFAAWTLAG